MLRTGAQYRDGREVWIDGERVDDITTHPALKPIIDIRARIYDMQHEPAHAPILTFLEDNQRHSLFNRLPKTQADWHDKWRAVDAVMTDIMGVVTRIGDETVGEMWSLYDGRDVLNEIDPRFAANITRHIHGVIEGDVFHVSANTDPKGDRSKAPQDQDPDMMVHVVKETDRGIVLRGAKFETASGYADQAFLKPTVGAWTNEKLSDYAVGCIVKMGAPGVRHIARSGYAGKGSAADYPLASRFDEVDFPYRARQCPDPLGGRVFLSPHARCPVHPRHAAPPFGVPVRAAHSLHGRHDDRRGVVERQTDRSRQAAGRARETCRPRLLPREHQRAPDGRDRAGPEEPGWTADAAPVHSLCRPGARVLQSAADDAHCPRAVRRTNLRNAERRRIRNRRLAAMVGEILQPQRAVAGGGSAQTPGLRAQSIELRLCRPPPHLRAVRTGPALQSSGRRLRRLSTSAVRSNSSATPPAYPTRSSSRHDVRGRTAGDHSVRHARLEKFNTRDADPNSLLDNASVCMGVRAWQQKKGRARVTAPQGTRSSARQEGQGTRRYAARRKRD